jgi:hypothetical protein
MNDADDQAVRRLADRLLRQASAIGRVYLGIGVGTGALLGAALLADAGDWRLVSAGVWGVIGAFVGRALGEARAAALQLQALSAVRQFDATQ